MPRKLALAVAAVVAAMLSAVAPALAYTEQEIEEIFKALDTKGDGKVTRDEYAVNKVRIIYRNVPNAGTNLTFEQTEVSREFFDAADVDHDGTLSAVEIMDALRFEVVDLDNKGYFTLEDLSRFLKKIGR
jgi:Ca2+-binding EF-hand superfamily protein